MNYIFDKIASAPDNLENSDFLMFHSIAVTHLFLYFIADHIQIIVFYVLIFGSTTNVKYWLRCFEHYQVIGDL